ncbi:MAG: tRNA lysidine(34) synthetase TilS [Balneolaceae bacterium]|nr:tRNA lysidine(34) synthetase TilS [Balneolaceae bacterium]
MSRSNLLPIETRVANQVEKCFSSTTDPLFVVGVSGGPDSMALLHILHNIDVRAVVVHVNYQKRGEASDKDQELVEQLSLEWGFDCQTIRLDPDAAEGQNFQQWARRQRYEIFYDLMHEEEADAIITAHHQDDQIETVLQKLFRGAGIESWRGMQVWDPPLFRPLLTTTRKEIDDFVEERAVPFRTDRSNLESDFARNLLRNEWLSKLSDFFPGWRQNVLRIPEQAEVFSEALSFIEVQLTDDHDRLDLQTFSQLQPSLQKAVVLYLLKERDPGITVSTGALDQLDNLADLQTGQSIQLTEQFSLLKDRNYLKLVFEHVDSFSAIELEKNELVDRPFMYNGLIFAIEEFDNPDFDQTLYLDLDTLQWPISLRRWRAGDAFQPFGMEGHQKVADHLTNRKISAAQKDRAMVLESFEETIYAVIFPPLEKLTPPGTISELVKCDDHTSDSLVITWKR